MKRKAMQRYAHGIVELSFRSQRSKGRRREASAELKATAAPISFDQSSRPRARSCRACGSLYPRQIILPSLPRSYRDRLELRRAESVCEVLAPAQATLGLMRKSLAQVGGNQPCLSIQQIGVESYSNDSREDFSGKACPQAKHVTK